MKRFFYFLIFFHFLKSSSAQQLQPACKHFTTDDGLPSSETYRVLQDRKGFIWIATDKGVSRYDGYSFQNFSVKDGLPDNTVLNLFEDEAGRIWFIPISLRLSYWDGDSIRPYQYNNIIEKVMKSDLPVSFYADRNNHVLLSGKSEGCIELDKKGNFNHYQNKTVEDYTLEIMDMSEGKYFGKFLNLNIHHEGNLYLYVNTSNTKDTIVIKNFNDGKTVFRIRKLKNGNLIFGAGSEVYIIRPDHSYFNITVEGKFTSFFEDKDQELWISSSKGLVRYTEDLSRDKKIVYFKDKFITGITGDNENGYWICTLDNGVFYMPSKEIQSINKEDGLSKDHILHMQSLDDSSLLFADASGQMQLIKNNMLHPFKHPYDVSPEYYRTFYFDSKNDMLWQSWSTYAVLFKHGKRSYYGDICDISDFYKANDNKIYCSSSMRLIILDGINKIFDSAHDSLYFRVSTVFQDSKGQILIGNHKGLWKFNGKREFEKYNSKNPNLDNRITSISEDNLHHLFLGTRGKGIIVQTNDSTFYINTTNGLTSDNIQQLFFVNNVLFVATNIGITKIIFSDINHFKYYYRQITVNDGLIGNEINQILYTNNNLWVATNKGISVFNPDKLIPDTFQSPVYIQNINIADVDTIVRTDTFNLSPDQNRLKINYTGIIIKGGGKVEYRYRLLGLDSSWNYTSAREANFNSLPPGNYQFQLQVQNKSGEWSSRSTSAYFFITTPLWKKAWFIALLFVLALASAYTIYRRRLSNIEKAEAAKTEMNRKIANLELKALRAQMNPHFTFNVMNSIQHFIANNDMESALRYMAKFAKLIRIILTQSEFSLVKLSDKLQSLQLYVELEQLRFEEKFDVDFKIDENVNTETTRVPTMIIQPYIENAIKHGIMHKDSKGRLLISLERQNGSIIWTVEDNGVGRKQSTEINKRKNKTHNSIGMKNTSERIETLNALYGFTLRQEVIDLYDENGNATGTRVIVTLPFISN